VENSGITLEEQHNLLCINELGGWHIRGNDWHGRAILNFGHRV